MPNTARLCIMNPYLHGIDDDPCPIRSGVDIFDAKPAQRKPWTKKLWVYDLRTNMHFTL